MRVQPPAIVFDRGDEPVELAPDGDIRRRQRGLFLADAGGRRPCHGDETRYARDPNFRDLVLFHEYFHGDNGRGLGASHQTGWTGLIAKLLHPRRPARMPDPQTAIPRSASPEATAPASFAPYSG